MGALKKTVEQLEQLHNEICGVWHDNTQRPTKDGALWYVIEFENKFMPAWYDTEHFITTEYKHGIRPEYVTKWAYLDDLAKLQ